MQIYTGFLLSFHLRVIGLTDRFLDRGRESKLRRNVLCRNSFYRKCGVADGLYLVVVRFPVSIAFLTPGYFGGLCLFVFPSLMFPDGIEDR